MRRLTLLLFLGFAAVPAAGQEWVAGIEATSDTSHTWVTHYTRSGPITLWQTVSYLRYVVREGDGVTQIESPGLSTGATYHWTAGTRTASLGAGYEMRWTDRRSPSGESTTETQRGPIAEGELVQRFGQRTSARLAGRWSGANQWRATSLEVRRQISRALRVGPQIIWQGTEEIDVLSAGALVETPLGESALQLRAGMARIRHPNGPDSTQPYFSAGIVVPF